MESSESSRNAPTSRSSPIGLKETPGDYIDTIGLSAIAVDPYCELQEAADDNFSTGNQNRSELVITESRQDQGCFDSSQTNDVENITREDTKLKAFTILFDGDERNSEQQQKHEKMLERFERRGRKTVSTTQLRTSTSHNSMINSEILQIREPVSKNWPTKSTTRNQNSVVNEEVVLSDEISQSTDESIRKKHGCSISDQLDIFECDAESDYTDRSNKHENYIRVSDPLLPKTFIAKSSVLQTILHQTEADKNGEKVNNATNEQSKDTGQSSNRLGDLVHPLITTTHNVNDGDDLVSEAGTYTLDGDNYTEEQKEMMDIDNFKSEPSSITTKTENFENFDLDTSSHDTDNKAHSSYPNKSESESLISDADNNTCNFGNIRKVENRSISYLAKIQTKVKHKLTHLNSNEVLPDIGQFTSITTSGVLSIQPHLDKTPKSKFFRRHSLTKSQIDNYEYVQFANQFDVGRDKNNVMEPILGGHHINLCPSDNEEFSFRNTPTDGALLTNVATKNDWIHEWARNARKNTTMMTKSLTLDSDVNRLMNKGELKINRPITVEKHLKMQLRSIPKSFFDMKFTKPIDSSDIESSKKSQCSSKIPSPIQCRTRRRSLSKHRLENSCDLDKRISIADNETNVHLQNTAEAIKTLQNIQLGKPSKYTCSYEDHIEKIAGSQQLHKRNLSLDGRAFHQKTKSALQIINNKIKGRNPMEGYMDEALKPNLMSSKAKSLQRSNSFSVNIEIENSSSILYPKKESITKDPIKKSSSSNNFNDHWADNENSFTCGKSSIEYSRKMNNQTYKTKRGGDRACPNSPEINCRSPIVAHDNVHYISNYSNNNNVNESSVKSNSSGSAKVLPKYLDISKYKTSNTGNYLKKNTSKNSPIFKQLSGTSTGTFQRSDTSRVSNRSEKSNGTRRNVKKEAPVSANVTREKELAMWKRRASYDPMKAALEGKKRQDAAKKLTISHRSPNEGTEVMRSQSFHAGTSTMMMSGIDQSPRAHWILSSPESSD